MKSNKILYGTIVSNLCGLQNTPPMELRSTNFHWLLESTCICYLLSYFIIIFIPCNRRTSNVLYDDDNDNNVTCDIL